MFVNDILKGLTATQLLFTSSNQQQQQRETGDLVQQIKTNELLLDGGFWGV